MVQYCCVPGCRSSAVTPGISLHRIPKNMSIRKMWIIKIKRDERKSKVSSSMRVCSAHFLPTDYSTEGLKIKRLKKTAVPSIFSFTSPKKLKTRRHLVRFPTCDTESRKEQNDDSSESRSTIDAENSQFIESEEDTNSISEMIVTNANNSFKSTAENSQYIEVEDDTTADDAISDESAATIAMLKEKIEGLEKTIHDVKRGRALHPTFTMNIIKGDIKLLKYYTGFDNLSVFNSLYSFMTANETISFSTKLSIEDQILLVLCKLRQNFDFIDLAFRFNVEEKLASTVFVKWINVLYCRLGSLSIWPHRDVIFKHMPTKFKTKYPNTIIILDATEMKIECPSSLVLQSQSYSSYKSTNTVKGLIGCDPNGAVIFISQLHMGNISDKKIVHDSGFYSILKEKLQNGEILPNDTLMADKGFNIREEIESLGLHLNVPPMATAQQFEKEEVQETRKIASCRIIVERAIRKIKCFKILKGTISIHMLPHINQIWTVCSILSNVRISTKNQ